MENELSLNKFSRDDVRHRLGRDRDSIIHDSSFFRTPDGRKEGHVPRVPARDSVSP